ncbi:hypothetical protein HYH03_003830 [Edaphochlamys debaryana]|uniref:Uncharacterized protein n=1 Tax=Edaphochlamys debaryana TaxID=47281 RepID=A0A836C2S2_9CHLO|nr:hypothetical protein HYH03_003830 [Edaphochlamys debaryana]|eukprot:KAG2498070.1 hypothetical protein HYH03_003830 [Edaphochlamys debaryana]
MLLGRNGLPGALLLVLVGLAGIVRSGQLPAPPINTVLMAVISRLGSGRPRHIPPPPPRADGSPDPVTAMRNNLNQILLDAMNAELVKAYAPIGQRGANNAATLALVAREAMALANETNHAYMRDRWIGFDALLQESPELAGLPAVRRVWMAGQGIRRMWDEGIPKFVEEQVGPVVMRLMRSHVESVRRKGVIELAHVSKSGGTSLCKLAQQANCSTRGFDMYTNCLIREFDDGPRWLDPERPQPDPPKGAGNKCKPIVEKDQRPRAPSGMGCKQRREFMLQHNYTMYSNEYTAVGSKHHASEASASGLSEEAKEAAAAAAAAHACSNMVTALMLRHPVPRVASFVSHLSAMSTRRCGSPTSLLFSEDEKAEAMTFDGWAAVAPAHLDNLLIRSLLGEALYLSPPGSITREHLAAARLVVLQQYDILLPLDDPPSGVDGTNLATAALRGALGWTAHNFKEARHNARAPDAPDSPLQEMLRSIYDDVKDKQQVLLDAELYEYALTLARLDAIVWDVGYVAETKGANATANGTVSAGVARLGGPCGYLGTVDDAPTVVPAKAAAAAAGAGATAAGGRRRRRRRAEQ